MAAPQYEIINMSVSDLDRIDLPRFQRRFVWNRRKKESFITTLHEGLPFGAVLVYPKSKDPDAPLLILDGQQRLSTIREFRANPLIYWKSLEHDEYVLQLRNVNECLPEEKELQEKDFDSLLEEQDDALDDWLDDIDDKISRKRVRAIIRQTKNLMSSYINLDSLKIPAIEFRGSRERIADVFANLNQGGVPLSKYEIYSAAWVHTEIHLDKSKLQESILWNVKQHYANMSQSTEFELDGFSEDELTQERTITLSELGIALGMFIRDNLKALAPQTDNAAAELGFGILGIATDTDNRKLDTLIGSVGYIESELSTILSKVNRICRNLQDLFSKILKRFKSSKNDEYALGISTTFKTLSYFAALWDLDPESHDYRQSLKNIKAYYLYDALSKSWQSKGDLRLMDYYPSHHRRDYLTKINRDAFIESFNRWLSDSAPGINFSKENTAIVTIHANLTYLAKTVSYGESFELEHIIPRKLINAHDNKNPKKVLGNSIGNCMYLPRLDNNKKKDKTLYDVNQSGRYDKLIRESLYFSQPELDMAIKAIERHEFAVANEKISRRARKVAEATVEALLA
ncbi:DUF262 domain-containing protein [Collinsella intestinalis]|uniref:DUF262 domain-containing protein n=1 Tax=Collinsella intestinalis TaxID=147207 RepID=UPI00195AF196|nr:DUF262 domain-containing protein [Collinsella intestinalis]MBM6683350.1 DUF262 domain-containing protein [Collinsella intestinalis]